MLALYALCALPWISARVWLEVLNVRESPQLYSSLILGQVERYKPYSQWFYTVEPVYSFHAGIPMPPDLAVVSLKRMWTGQISSARIAQEMRDIQPGIVMLRNDTKPTFIDDLIAQRYQLVYQDSDYRLYIHKSIVNKPPRSTL